MRGWTAVATTGPEATGPALEVTMRDQLRNAGWQVGQKKSEGSAVTLRATRTGVESEWLNISITEPLPGAGPALTFRYAAGPDPVASVSAS